MEKAWKIVKINTNLDLKLTLLGGQSFRWQEKSDGEFFGVFSNILWLLKVDNKTLKYKIVGELQFDQSLVQRMKVEIPVKQKKTEKATHLYKEAYYENLLKNYFRLNVDLESLYDNWKIAHQHFQENSVKFRGIRQLNQDPVENLFSFICSQNNNISRISGLVEKICSNWGQKICEFEDISYFNFPNVESLAKEGVEKQLRELGFGYRAKYIQQSAEEIVKKGGLEWFEKLQNMPYKEARQELMSLTGIGPKVADCICLMSLNHLESIPVDTHILQIAQHYIPKLAGKDKKKISMTGKLYLEISDKFREIYGSNSGWAQTVLFCSDIRQFNKEEPDTKKKRKE